MMIKIVISVKLFMIVILERFMKEAGLTDREMGKV
jgi:hypothetical protein